jgi:putative FmdB family regulatory protein
MPVYTYRCDSCGVRFDRHQSYDEAPLTRCPECKKKSLRKVIAPVGVVFKGSGFYSTDHKTSSGNGSARQAKKDGGGETSKQAGETPAAKESKPADKETKPAESKD